MREIAFIYIFLLLSIVIFGDELKNIHPQFPLLDENGVNILESKLPFSEDKTCGACHDTKFIKEGSTHKDTEATCITCHTPKGELIFSEESFDSFGNLKKEFIEISAPTTKNCVGCHSIYSSKNTPLIIPHDFGDEDKYRLSRTTGAIFSPEKIKESGFNLKGKESLATPWDVHASRELSCNSCHYPHNSISQHRVDGNLKHLKNDPRKGRIGEFLLRPNHKLQTSTCTDCHDPLKTHDFLPYKERHFQILSCESCHVPHIYSPALQLKDSSLLQKNMNSIEYYRGVQNNLISDKNSINTIYQEGYTPFLLVENKKIKPVNVVTEYFWSDNDKKITSDELGKAIFENGEYKKDFISLFDSNKNASIEKEELKIDTENKKNYIVGELKKIGFKNPILISKQEAFPVNHQILRGEYAQKECGACHGTSSRFSDKLALTTFNPPIDKFDTPSSLLGLISQNGDKIGYKNGLKGIYIPGFSRNRFVNALGPLIILLTLLGVFGHATIRFLTRKKRSHHNVKIKKIFLYPFYERVWHWLMAGGVILLLLTGMAIHFTDKDFILPINVAVAIHNTLAAIVLINAIFALFYHFVTGEIKQFLPPVKSFITEMIAQMRYYGSGIFKGAPHPLEKTPQRKLNPLQQMTYLAVLNILIPTQVITGVMIWGAGLWPEFSEKIGGLTYIVPIHRLVACLFIAYIVIHVYMTTTGHTLTAEIKSMFTGYADVEEHTEERLS
ncbi:cytochrome b/b6 domain-containing protein [bacterium]|nr:cytochrome b/b6 domain-containing protein [bacterium]